MFGDLLQLSPVVSSAEKEVIEKFYPEGEYFFNAKCFNSGKFVTKELTKIFRQSDENFINLLNKFRIAKVDTKDLKNNSILRLRKEPDKNIIEEEQEEITNDDFETQYKGEVSKSGVAILPSKRARKIPIQQATTEVKKEKVKEETSANQPLKLTEEVEEEKK